MKICGKRKFHLKSKQGTIAMLPHTTWHLVIGSLDKLMKAKIIEFKIKLPQKWKRNKLLYTF